MVRVERTSIVDLKETMLRTAAGAEGMGEKGRAKTT